MKRRPVYFSYFATFLSRQHFFPPDVSYTFISVWWMMMILCLLAKFSKQPSKRVPCSQSTKTCVSTLIRQFSYLNWCATYTRPFLKKGEWCIAHTAILRIHHFQNHPTFVSIPIIPWYFFFSDTPSTLRFGSFDLSIQMATLAVSVGFSDILLYKVQSLSNLKYDMNLKHSMQCDAFSTCRMNQGLYTKGA